MHVSFAMLRSIPQLQPEAQPGVALLTMCGLTVVVIPHMKHGGLIRV